MCSKIKSFLGYIILDSFSCCKCKLCFWLAQQQYHYLIDWVGFMVSKSVWYTIEVKAYDDSVSFRKTTLTGMCYQVPAFAGMTKLLGGDRGDSSL